MAGLKLFFYRASPPGASGYCSGGAGVIAANTASEALGLLLQSGVDVYGYYPYGADGKISGPWQHELPTELVVPAEPGILEYEGVSE